MNLSDLHARLNVIQNKLLEIKDYIAQASTPRPYDCKDITRLPSKIREQIEARQAKESIGAESVGGRSEETIGAGGILQAPSNDRETLDDGDMRLILTGCSCMLCCHFALRPILSECQHPGAPVSDNYIVGQTPEWCPLR